MIACLLSEIEMQQQYFQQKEISSIYIGGGTPTLLETTEIESILNQVKSTFNVASTAECTIEANPDDLNPQKIRSMVSVGINRISLGIQSFFDEDLKFMNRSHDSTQALNCIKWLTENGIQNFSADLIFGFQGLSTEKWKHNIDQVLQLNIPHISCYGMTVEPKTALSNFIKNKKVAPIDEKQSATQYDYLISRLTDAGYHHYEISNFAKPGYEARHNSSYWQQEPYLGIGPSAHSYDGTKRQWNIANNAKYIEQIQKNQIPSEHEILSRTQKINEYIMVSLRTSGGISLSKLYPLFTETEKELWKQKVLKYIQQQMMWEENEHLILSRSGKLYADGIASDLFL